MINFLKFIFRNNLISTSGVRDSYSYHKAMKKYLLNNPSCAFCGRTSKVDVHHKVPVSVCPERASDDTNMITLCRKPQCHLVVGHLGNFKKYNSKIEEVCGVMKNDINKTN